MKKNLKILLTMLIISSLVFTTALATPGNSNNNGQMNKEKETLSFQYSFNDLTGHEWAQKSIKTMSKMGIIKGEGNYKFSPARSAKEIEVIIMALRFMGVEDDLDLDSKMPKNYKGNPHDSWMNPYIELAVENDILLDDELTDFNPNRSASRSQAAVYIIRALDKVKEAEDMNDTDLSLLFKDANAIPVEHIGYVALMNKLGLMIGYNDSFHPNKPITRAELAVLFDRISNLNDTEYVYTVYGRIITLNEESILIKNGSKSFEYDFDEEMDIYDENEDPIDLNDLSQNDYVRLHIIEDEVFQIDLLDDNSVITNKVYSKFTGELTDFIETTSGAIVGIHVDLDNDTSTTASAFTFNDDIKIKFEGNLDDELLESHIGLDVVLRTIDSEIYNLYVKYDKFEGILDSVNTSGSSVTSVEITPNTTTSSIEYDFAPNAQIEINNESADLEDLANLNFNLGFVYNVNAKLLGDDEIINLCIDYVVNEYNGTLISYNTTSPSITVLLNDSITEQAFNVVSGAAIENTSGTAISLSDLIIDSSINFFTNFLNEITKIIIQE